MPTKSLTGLKERIEPIQNRRAYTAATETIKHGCHTDTTVAEGTPGEIRRFSRRRVVTDSPQTSTRSEEWSAKTLQDSGEALRGTKARTAPARRHAAFRAGIVEGGHCPNC